MTQGHKKTPRQICVLLFQKIFAWSNIRKLGSSKAVSSSYFWLIATPILARLLSNLPETLKFNIGGQDIVIPAELPFSWEVFYYAAICFAVGTLIYNLSCPKLIKDYKSFNEFYDSGGSNRELHDMYREIIFDNNPELLDDIIPTLFDAMQESGIQSPSVDDVEARAIKDEAYNMFPRSAFYQDFRKVKRAELGGLFYKAYLYYETKNILPKFPIILFYSIGLGCLITVFWESLIWVLKAAKHLS